MLRFSPNPNCANLIRWLENDDEAFEKARAEKKPVMLFLAAFWCGYCQRMDEGAFSERENLALLNAYFVPLRVENAARPDIDARYNLNGWPTIAFFSPAGALMSAANYLPGDSFRELLLQVLMAYRNETDDAAADAPARASAEAPGCEPEIADMSVLEQLTAAIMAQIDRVNGGYGSGQKFLHPAANDFLLGRYESSGERSYLAHVCQTLERMRVAEIYDRAAGGYFRTASGADWSQPHREKLLSEQTGLLSNCLAVFRVTGKQKYAAVAEEIVHYIESRLYAPDYPAFFGCEDFPKREGTASAAENNDVLIDRIIYVDANAAAARAYLDAARLLGQPEWRERALGVVEFLWERCRSEAGMYHFFDGAPQLSGLLIDQAETGRALLAAERATGDRRYLERARQLAETIIARLKNGAGGYYDIIPSKSGFSRIRLIDIEQNGSAARFFLDLWQATGDAPYREAARWALRASSSEVVASGVQAARFGSALNQYLWLVDLARESTIK